MDNRKGILKFSFICCAVGMVGTGYASDFYTIIGPDGRPMVVQQKESQKAKKPQQNIRKIEPEITHSEPTNVEQSKTNQVNETNENIVEKTKANIAHNLEKESSVATKAQSNSVIAKPKKVVVDSSIDNRKIRTESSTQLKEVAVVEPKVVSSLEVETQTSKSSISKNNQHQSIDVDQKIPNAQIDSNTQRQTDQIQSSESTVAKVESTKSTDKKSKITTIDGVEYVDNEYLEDQEFNLEGKKRFYIMPDSSVGGSRRFETVEREKGISKSVFSKFLKTTVENQAPVVLASTYYRLPKDQVEESLEQSCFEGKKMERAKLLSFDKNEMGIWPVPPIKEKFVYEVVKLDSPVENIQLTSYASSQKSPTYYWPLVVFLDNKGCVIEGVSGFKNKNQKSNQVQFSAVEGILKKPKNATYMFMTPLAEAVDVENIQLSNKGQIKLNVLR